MIDLLFDGPLDASQRLVLAHGAGAGMESAFMRAFAEGLADRGVRVARFEFSYMERRRTGVRAPPERAPILLDRFRAVMQQLGESADWFIGGKSMGGRMASMLADELAVAGLVCLGYPFHPPGRPERTRVAHLATLRTRCLIVQGTRDALGTVEDVAQYQLSRSTRIVWIEDGDHSLVPRRSSGITPNAALASALDAVASFMRVRPRPSRKKGPKRSSAR